VVGENGADGHSGEDGKLLGQSGRSSFEMKALEFKLGDLQARLQQVQIGVDAGLGALPFNRDQAAGESLLLARCFEFAADRVQLNVGRGCVQSHLLPCILEAQVGGVQAGAGSLGVLALRVAQNQRLHGGAADRGLARREAMRVADCGADHEVGDIRALGLGQGGLGPLHIGFGQLDGAGVALGQVYHRGQRDLGMEMSGRSGKRQCQKDWRPCSARIGCDLHLRISCQRLVSWRLQSCAGL
jgi:hypothetical protein